MQTAYGAGKYQWALQLADALIDTDNSVKKAKVFNFFKWT
jgi:hypothetical protein